MAKRRSSPPSPILVQRSREAGAEMITPPLTGPLKKDIATATRASVNGYTTDAAIVSPPATPGDAVDRREGLRELDDVPLPYVVSKLIAIGRQYLNDTATCDAFVRAVPIHHLAKCHGDMQYGSINSTNGNGNGAGRLCDKAIPMHLEYAVYRAPYLGRILQSPDVQQGDLVEVPMPNPQLWPVVVGWMYTGMFPKALLEPLMETLKFLEVQV